MTHRIGVLLSGRGSNFEALADSVSAGRIPNTEIAVVLSNKPAAPGLERAKSRGIPARVIPSKGLEREAYDRQVVTVLQEYKVDLICLAGYMRLLSPYFVAAFPQRILNIHPSLLPSSPASNPKSKPSTTASNSPAAPSISWTKISTPAPSSCKPSSPSSITTTNTPFPNAS